jgi:hypothetical protein
VRREQVPDDRTLAHDRQVLKADVLSGPPPWLLVEPPHGIASGKAELMNALHCLLSRQRDLVPVVREVSAIPFHDLVKLGAKGFIRG